MKLVLLFAIFTTFGCATKSTDAQISTNFNKETSSQSNDQAKGMKQLKRAELQSVEAQISSVNALIQEAKTRKQHYEMAKMPGVFQPKPDCCDRFDLDER